MKKLIFILAILIHFQLYGQKFISSLYGFKIGQYRCVTKNELGKPIRYGKYPDGFVYEAFLLKPDSSLYAVFEYAAKDTNIIWSIQVTGHNNTTDIGFKNLKLGIDRYQTEKLLGKPNRSENIGKYGERWYYDKTNYSVEVNTRGLLSSIKILNNAKEILPETDINRAPDFDQVCYVLNSGKRDKIMDLLCGDFEAYFIGRVYSFKKSFGTEQATDYSGVLSLIALIATDLKSVNIHNKDEFSECLRVIPNQDTEYVMKLNKGHQIKEIVLKNTAGRYLIYEINANNKK